MNDHNKLQGIIIEDEEMSMKHLNNLLKDIDGVEILSNFENGAKAIATINNKELDFILLDIETPDLNGLDFLRFSKHLPPVIFTTANPNYASDAIQLGAIDFLNKPIRSDQLTAALNKVKERSYTQQSIENKSRSNPKQVEVHLIDPFKREEELKEQEKRKLNAILSWRSVYDKWCCLL